MVFMHLKGAPYEMGSSMERCLPSYIPKDLRQMRDESIHLRLRSQDLIGRAGFKKFYFQYKMAPWIRRNIPDAFSKSLRV